MARFCRMFIAGGELDGRRVLGAEAVRQMTTRQTPPHVSESYGLGCDVNGPAFGHGGARATNMCIDPAKGLATVWLVHHEGFAGDGGKAMGEFQKAAERSFGRTR